MARKQVIVGLDIGSSKVTAIAGSISGDGHIDILGVGEVPSAGLRKGTVVDIENTVKSIEQAVEKAEEMSGIEISSVYAGISGASIASINNHGVVAITGENKEISYEDVNRVMQSAKVINLPADRKIVHVIPREFSVDGYGEIIDPVGMVGSRLEVEAHIVTGANTCIQNLLKSIQRAGLKVEQLVLSALASSEAVLNEDEKTHGTVLVDIGSGTTDIAIFEGGSLWYTTVLPVGGEYITNDLAFGLRTSIAQAEQIKKENGRVLSELAPDNEFVSVKNLGGKDVQQVSIKMISTIIEPRIQEILTLVKGAINKSGSPALIPGGVVLTGGVAQTPGLVEMAMNILNMPVRLGLPENIGGLSDITNNSTYSTGIGLIRYGSRFMDYKEDEVDNWDGFLGKVINWFREFF